MRSTSGNPSAALTSVTGEAMSLKSVQATGQASGLLLELTVRQVYRNDTAKTLETVYTFPLAWGAVLMDLNVEIAGKRLSGVAVEAKDAEERYEEAVADGETGFVISDPEDTQAVADAFAALLDSDELRREMGERSRQRVLDEFAYDVLARRLGDTLRVDWPADT